jgi:ABC-type glutathione transport system ATPase component
MVCHQQARGRTTVRRKKHEEAEITWDDAVTTPPDDFLPDEATQELRIAGNDLRDRVAKIEMQMMAQYTAMAAYATISQNNTDAAKAEARHDLERTQATLIGLIERVRRECNDALAAIQTRGGSSGEGDGTRVGSLESRFDDLAGALERSIDTQRALAEQVAMLLEDKMQREGWLVANGNGDDLSLR